MTRESAAKGLWVLLAVAGFYSQAHAGMAKAKNPPKVAIDANRSRSTKIAGGDWDDKLQKVQLEISVKNLDLNKSVEGLTLYYWTLAQSLVDKKAYLVIDAGTFDVNLNGSTEGREIHHQCEEITLKWDDTYAVFGQRYKGYVIVLVNAQKEVVAVKANLPTWQTAFERAFELEKKSWCGMDLKPLSGAPKRARTD